MGRPVAGETDEQVGVEPSLQERIRAREQRRFYPEVQALRAVAIGMVLLFHYGSALSVVQGGYAGVDVFFVISGFLITSHLIGEVERTGRVRLGAFYARRARRLLPASLSVLAVVALAIPLVLPRAEWGDAGRGVLASSFYGMNLFAAHDVAFDPSSTVYVLPTIHYWSLSAEEQFYLLWPPLILLAVGVAAWRRRHGGQGRPVLAAGVTLAVVAVVSFVVSVVWTLRDQEVAFFVTPTRVWEFAAGGLLVMLLRRWVPTRRTATVLRWAGLVVILPGSLLLALPDVLPGPGVLSASDAFPGPMALPAVIGTAFVIVAGGTQTGTLMHRVVAAPPTQWLGLISYSVYLWHWPLIPLVEAWRGGLGGPVRLGLLLLTLLLGHVWQRWVEDASRYVTGMKTSTPMTLWAALAGMVLTGAAGLALVTAGT